MECDSCTGRKRKAVKSCLVCLASYYETHLQPHHESPAFNNHRLVQATRRLQEQSSAQVSTECTEKIFTEHLNLLWRKQSEVVEMIKAQEMATARQAEILLEELEQEIRWSQEENR
ncbi:hypothetical protein AOLI_G00199850 [Acnodon oligacanthus]